MQNPNALAEHFASLLGQIGNMTRADGMVLVVIRPNGEIHLAMSGASDAGIGRSLEVAKYVYDSPFDVPDCCDPHELGEAQEYAVTQPTRQPLPPNLLGNGNGDDQVH